MVSVSTRRTNMEASEPAWANSMNPSICAREHPAQPRLGHRISQVGAAQVQLLEQGLEHLALDDPDSGDSHSIAPRSPAATLYRFRRARRKTVLSVGRKAITIGREVHSSAGRSVPRILLRLIPRLEVLDLLLDALTAAIVLHRFEVPAGSAASLSPRAGRRGGAWPWPAG